jgi:hypothetical protein
MLRVHSVLLAVDDVLIDAVFDIRAHILLLEDSLRVCLVFGEKLWRFTLAPEVVHAEFRVRREITVVPFGAFPPSSEGLRATSDQDQVLRNQSVGKT